MRAIHPWSKWASNDGSNGAGTDHAQVSRVEDGMVHFSYLCVPGDDPRIATRYPPNASGRDTLSEAEFRSAFPLLREDKCVSCSGMAAPESKTGRCNRCAWEYDAEAPL